MKKKTEICLEKSPHSLVGKPIVLRQDLRNGKDGRERHRFYPKGSLGVLVGRESEDVWKVEMRDPPGKKYANKEILVHGSWIGEAPKKGIGFSPFAKSYGGTSSG